MHDKVFEELVDAVEPIKGPRGRPRKRPEKLHADKGYDYPRCRRFLRRLGIKARIARRGVESSEKLGRYRWTVERSFAGLFSYWRLCCRAITCNVGWRVTGKVPGRAGRSLSPGSVERTVRSSIRD